MPNHASSQLLGHAVRQPELTYTPQNTAICKFSLAVNRTWGSGDNKQEDVSYFDCEAWAKAGEIINKYLQKGDAFYCTAEPRQDRWQDQQGNNRSKIKFVVRDFQFIGGRNDGNQGQPNTQQRQPEPQGQQPIEPEDIPF